MKLAHRLSILLLNNHIFYRLEFSVKDGSPVELKAQVRTEVRLLLTYNVQFPEATDSVPGCPDHVSLQILQLLDPKILNDFVPVYVTGDGNCLFRALSRALYSTEKHHAHLRLLSALEMLAYPSFYDSSAPDYQDLIRDPQIIPEK